MLARDPDQGYVYWEWPADRDVSGPTTVAIYVADQQKPVQVIEVSERRGGQFVDFEGPDRVHHAELRLGDKRYASEELRSPRRQPGNEEPRFVQVRMGSQGLTLSPRAHKHPALGTFPAAQVRAGTSATLVDS